MRFRGWTLAFLLTLWRLAPSASGQDCEGWRDLGPPTGGRVGHALAFDSYRGVTVLFGGSDEHSSLGDTWEWDGATWVPRRTTGPTPRTGHAMAYDSARRVTVLYGGTSASGAVGDTWEWNGTTWSLRSSAGPGGRFGHSLAYDSVRHVMVLFGGSTGAALASRNVWEWNGTSWSQRSGTGPSARQGQSMAFDPLRNRTVLFGGSPAPNSVSSETWEWNGSAWSARTTSGPRAQATPQLVYDNQRRAVLLFGAGSVAGGPGETWQWNGTAWSQRSTSGPAFLGGQALGFDGVRGRAVLFGGESRAPYETWEWDGATWGQRAGAATGARSTLAMAYDSLRETTVWFGGGLEGPRTMEWDGTTWTLASSVGPPPREFHALAYDSVRGVTVLFGGRGVVGDLTEGGGDDFSTEFGDTWEWNGATWTQRSSTGPTPRYGHALAFDPQRRVTVLFGGTSFDGTEEASMRDTWEWNGQSWSLRSTTGPSPRFGHAMTYDPLRSRTVLFGGRRCADPCCNTFGDTWTWNGSGWSQRNVAGPAPRSESAMTYDTVSGLVLLFGGQNGLDVRYNDLWQWNGGAWLQRVDVGPPARAGHGLVYDITRRSAFLFGGLGGFSDAWEYGCDATCSGSVLDPAEPELHPLCPGGPCYATKNRYLTFIPPVPPCGQSNTALRVTFGPMPGPADCPGIPDYSRFNGTVMWVGQELLYGEFGDLPTGVYELQSTPRFFDWRSVTGGVVHVADCNIVPCSTYTIEVILEQEFAAGRYSPPLVLDTTPLWGDVVGPGNNPADGFVDALDVVGIVDGFRSAEQAPPRSWCDLSGNRPYQGQLADVDAMDIGSVLDAFRGYGYPFSGPSAPASCPGTP